MDDDDKKFTRRKGPKPAGPRGRDGAGGQSPAGGKKPFVKRGEKTEAGERPRRDFRRDDRPKGGEGERPQRDFKKRDYKPREATDERPARERPFSKGPRSEGKPYEKRDGGRKSYEKREGAPRPGRFERGERAKAADGERSERRFDRPKRDFGGKDRRPAKDFKPRPRPAQAAAAETGERIAKRLARAGIASRRDAEALIEAGRVKVNGTVLSSPAFNVTPSDVIHLDGTEIPPVERTRLFLFHKPAGVVTTNRDPEGRRTVFDVLPAELPRLMTVGRLDINTEGLLLLTNDGGLARALELPATGWLRRYRTRVHGKVEEKALANLREGIAVYGVFYGAIEASLDREQGTNAWLTLGLREGKNREVKNILGALGLEVTRLIRISYGPFQLGELPEGHVLEIKGRTLRDQLGERLIEESGANFDAEIAKPFSNKPVRRTEPRAEAPERSRMPRDDWGRIGEGGLIKARKRRENSREEALNKLSTRPDRQGFDKRGGKTGQGGFGGKPERGGKRPERAERPIEPPGQRRANVWMAPGARPKGGKHQALSPLEGEMSPKVTEGVGKGGAGRKRTSSAADRAPPPASGRTLPPRGRGKPRKGPKR